MKRLKLAMLAMFAFLAVSNTVNAQDENNPWAVGFGVNAVDIRTGKEFGDIAKDYFGVNDWNVLPSISRISVERYLNKGFIVQLAGSINKIETVYKKEDSDLLYWAIDANVKYDLNNLIGETSWFDPYIYIGGGYTNIGDNGEGMVNAGAGFNTWFNDNLGLNFQTGGKRQFGGKVKDHFQHSIGLIFRFGGKDTDGDGVYDKDDACPEVAGLKQFNGCPDTDGDGIKDSEDACPEVAGLASLNGCPDADGDGIADKDDECPNAKGTKAMRGCPDTDGDGVADKDDKCPTVPGPAANSGCPWPDTDGDGILDKDDKCPKVPGVASRQGCPEPIVIITDEEIKVMGGYAKTILFNSGRSSFRPGVKSKLDAIVAIMKQRPRAKFRIEGHTDSSGRASTNLRLSERRAEAVRSYLVSQGISSSRLTAKGYGETTPIDTNRTRAGRANNRRVEVKVTNRK